MKNLLLIALLIVGCDNSTGSNNNPLLGKWQITETENWYLFQVDKYIEITDDDFIRGGYSTMMDAQGNPQGTCFSGSNFSYVDNNPTLILSTYREEEITSEHYLTYQISNSELNLQYLFKIIDGDTTHCVDCYAIATAVNEIPEYDCTY